MASPFANINPCYLYRQVTASVFLRHCGTSTFHRDLSMGAGGMSKKTCWATSTGGRLRIMAVASGLIDNTCVGEWRGGGGGGGSPGAGETESDVASLLHLIYSAPPQHLSVKNILGKWCRDEASRRNGMCDAACEAEHRGPHPPSVFITCRFSSRSRNVFICSDLIQGFPNSSRPCPSPKTPTSSTALASGRQPTDNVTKCVKKLLECFFFHLYLLFHNCYFCLELQYYRLTSW